MKIPAAGVNTIAVFRALQLGDLLCSIPAFRVLRHAYPAAKISLIGLPGMKGLAKRFGHYIDEFIEFPGYPGLPEQPYDPVRFDCFLKAMKDRKFDLLLQMQGNGSVVNDMLQSFEPEYLAGFCEMTDERQPLLLQYPAHGHESLRHLALMRHLDACSDHAMPPELLDDSALEFPIYQEDILEFEKMEMPLRPGKYICLHPGSRGSWRQWPPSHFAAIGDYCAKLGYDIVVTGTAAEADLALEVASMMKSVPLVCAGKTTLGAMAVMLERAHGLISNCTGVSHIAAALEKQSVVISMDGEPDRWGPLNQLLHRTVDWTRHQDYGAVLKEVNALFFKL